MKTKKIIKSSNMEKKEQLKQAACQVMHVHINQVYHKGKSENTRI